MEIEQYNPYQGKKKGRIIISCSISPDFWELAKSNHIGWSEALRVGISIILAERGVKEYDNRLNLFRKMKKFQQLAEEYMEKHDQVKSKLDKKGENQLSAEADEILNIGKEVTEDGRE